MRYVYLLLRIYPYWAIPLAAVFVQLAIFYNHRQNKRKYVAGGFAGVLLLTVVLWVVFRGDIRSDLWLRAVQGQ